MNATMSEMGLSVTGGALTTFVAGAFLFPCKVEMFYKFGYFITATAAFAYYYALVFFPALMNLIGPEGNFGDVKWAFRQLKLKIMNK